MVDIAPGVRAGDDGRVTHSFRRIATAEWVLIVLILLATAVMTSLYAPEHLEGAFGAGHGSQSAH